MGYALNVQHQYTETMTSLNSKLQLALLNPKKSRNKLQKGFTLVELLIVVIILGVLSAVALPAFLNQTGKAKVNAARASVVAAAKSCEVALISGEAGSNWAAPQGVGKAAPTGTGADFAPGAAAECPDPTVTPGTLFYSQVEGLKTQAIATLKVNGGIDV